MVDINLSLPGNVLHKEAQLLKFNKIATFIGGNGSGKSTILKSIFDEKLKGTDYVDYKIVCFSSGQNESYSKGFSKYLNNERAKKNALNLDCFYYDKSWSSLLIFLATTSKNDGLVREFLKEKKYISEDEYGQDGATTLTFSVKVERAYINIVKQARDDESKGETDVITNKAYYQTLYSFINHLIAENYDFENPLEQREVQLKQSKLSNVSFETDGNTQFDSKVIFFTQAADNDYFIIKDTFHLSFTPEGEGMNGDSLSLDDLSDGEYQLLFIFALIDLFDSENTLFLLDEADSHLHYKNIDILWKVFNDTLGKIITTTHLLDSITKSGIDQLRVIHRGEIKTESKLKYLSDRFQELSEINDTKLQIFSFYTNVVFIDDDGDWEIFKLLAIRKLAATEEEKLIMEGRFANFIAAKVPSSYKDDSEIFGQAKIANLTNFINYLKLYKYKTKNAYLICDRDNLQLSKIGTAKCNLLVKGNPLKNNQLEGLTCQLLSWRRREIKHYLLSATALGQENIDSINERLNLGLQSKLNVGSSGDYKTNGNYNEQLASLESDLVKDLLHVHIDIENQGFSVEKTKSYISRIPKEEISEDIVNMYNYLVASDE